MTMAAIARATGLKVKTRTKWIRRSDGEGSVATRPRSGRPRLVTPEDDQRIIQAVMERPLTSSIDITQELNLPCNPDTTRRHLNECDIKCCIPTKKEKLSPENMVSRLEFARHYTSDVFDKRFLELCDLDTRKIVHDNCCKSSCLLATFEHQVCGRKYTEDK